MRRDAPSRRQLLLAGCATACLALVQKSAAAIELRGMPGWNPRSGSPPEPIAPGPWRFFTLAEGAAIEALVDRLIPPDAHGVVGSRVVARGHGRL